MDAHKLQLKFFAHGSEKPELDAFVPVFHAWIRDKKLDDEVLIDVADYAHVPDGPGIVLIGHEADYYTDLAGGRLGLLYSKKRGPKLALQASIEDAFRKALRACTLLETDSRLSPALRFATDEILLRVNDRLAASNTPETFAALKPALESALDKLYGTRFEAMQEGTPRELFTVRIKLPNAPGAAQLLTRLAG